MTLRSNRIKIALFTGIVSYLVGCTLFYLIWYKNGEFLHVMIITLIVGGVMCIIFPLKKHNLLSQKSKSGRSLIVILLICILFGFGGLLTVLEKKRIHSIFKDGPNKQAIATVMDIDLRSTRSGKQPWSIIKYNAQGQTVEQSFADTSKNLAVGQKYLVQYSVKYPDMVRVLKKL